ncbi:MAG: hypothetical protein ACYTFY_12445 [Planctomycetota bacterium]
MKKVGSENVHCLIDALSFHDGSANWRLRDAISDLAKEKHKELIISKLEKQNNLVEVIIKYGWEKDARGILISQLSKESKFGSRFVPTKWIDAIANLKDPETYGILTDFLENGSNPSWTYKSIKDLHGIKLKEPILRLWEKKKVKGGYDVKYIAALAVKYGRKDALDRLIQELISPENHNYNMDEERKILYEKIGVKGTKKQIFNWYKENKDKIFYDEDVGKFVVK